MLPGPAPSIRQQFRQLRTQHHLGNAQELFELQRAIRVTCRWRSDEEAWPDREQRLRYHVLTLLKPLRWMRDPRRSFVEQLRERLMEYLTQ